MVKQKVYWLVWFLVFGLLTFLTLNKHSRSGTLNYHSEIWADKAGYYVYLPGLFNHHFKSQLFPDSIDVKTGDGFKLDLPTNKVITKYTYGVALFQSPFYLLADFLAPHFNQTRDGFSPIYHLAVNISAIFYFVLGLILLSSILTSIYNQRIAVWTTLLLFLGTNLYYYVIADTGMSHVYSFFLFSLLLFLLLKVDFFAKKSSLLSLVIIGSIAGELIIIRPTNVFGLAFLLFVQISNSSEVTLRIKSILQIKNLITILSGVILAFIPQMVYWYYLDGSFIKYTYGQEGFNWFQPQIIKSWFSPNNGLFLYGSVWVLIIISFIYSTLKNKMLIVYPILFLVITYVTSSWWAWNFGCSYGGRNYVEYLVFFSIPLGFLLSNFKNWNNPIKLLFVITSLLFIALNLHLIYVFDDCFFGNGDWDWVAYQNLITKNFY